MKKFLCAVLCALTFALSLFGIACAKDKESVTVYMPDGAPALSMASLLEGKEKFDRQVDYKVVDATVIQTFVSGESPKADLCVLPVNLATKLLGSGESYKLLGTVTHGNLFVMGKSGSDDITAENLSSLVGKTVGVINLPAVPGLTFRLILKSAGLDYSVLDGEDKKDDKVNLKAINADEAIPTNTFCDYFVVPEPAASAKEKGTGGKLRIAGSLQTLYGGEKGYPQAVLVAKNSLIEAEPEFVKSFISAVGRSAEYINGDLSEERLGGIVEAINGAFGGSVSSLDLKNLNKRVIKNCAVRFTPSKDCKEEINGYIQKLIGVNPAAAAAPSDNFYYAN